MVVRTKNEELRFLLVPVAAYAAETTCSVVEAVGHDSDLRLGVRNESAFEESVLGQSRHLADSLLAKGSESGRCACPLATELYCLALSLQTTIS